MKLRAEHILETCIYVDDLDAAEAFYGGVLGLERVARDPVRQVFFRCGAGMLLIFDPEQSAIPGRAPVHGAHGPGHVTFGASADALPAWRAHFAERGVEIEVEREWPNGARSIYFRDPAGNSLELATPSLWFDED